MGIENRVPQPPDGVTPELTQERKFYSPEKVSFDEKNFTVLLDLDKIGFDVARLQTAAESNGLTEKDEFHITVIGFKGGAEIKKSLKALGEPERAEKIQQLQALIDSTDWRFASEPLQYRIAKDYPADPKKPGTEPEHRESFIQIINVPALENFYSQLNALFGTAIECPPAHITMFTGGNVPENAKQGIGINTAADLEKLDPQPIS